MSDRQTDRQTPYADIYRAYAYASRGKNDYTSQFIAKLCFINVRYLLSLLTYLLTYLLRVEWSDIGEMWHAIAEWHDNYGDEVETEKQDGLKTKKMFIRRTGV